MPQQRDPFMWVARGTVRDGVDLVILTPPIRDRDQVCFCDIASVHNVGSSGGDVEVGLVMGGRFFELDTVFNLVAGMWHYARSGFTFLSNWQIYARFIHEQSACVDLDDCELHVVGYFLEPFTSP